MKKKIYTIASYSCEGIGGPAYRVAMAADPCMAEIRAMLPAAIGGFFLSIEAVENCPSDTADGILATGETRVYSSRFGDWVECVF